MSKPHTVGWAQRILERLWVGPGIHVPQGEIYSFSLDVGTVIGNYLFYIVLMGTLEGACQHCSDEQNLKLN